MRTKVGLAATAAAFLILPACTGANWNLGASQNTRQFVERAAQSHMTAAHIAQVAQSRGQRAEVKQFAQRVESDHRDAYARLSSVGSRKNISVPKGLDASHQETVRRFERLSGADLDTQFLQYEGQQNDEIVSLYRSHAANDTDADVKAYAAGVLPTLTRHQEMARELQPDAPVTASSAPPAQDARAAGEAARVRDEAGVPAKSAVPPPPADWRPPTRGQSLTREVVVERIEPGRVLEVRIDGRPGTHIYRLAEEKIATSIPAGVRPGDRVSITESTDGEGRYSLWVERAAGAANQPL